MGPLLDLDHDITQKIYGIGATEMCMDQNLKNTIIGKFKLTNFTVQIGDVREMHGLNGIIGSGNFKLTIDLNNMEVQNSKIIGKLCYI